MAAIATKIDTVSRTWSSDQHPRQEADRHCGQLLDLNLLHTSVTLNEPRAAGWAMSASCWNLDDGMSSQGSLQHAQYDGFIEPSDCCSCRDTLWVVDPSAIRVSQSLSLPEAMQGFPQAQ